MNDSGIFKKIWGWIKWPVIVLVVAFVAFFVWGVSLSLDKRKTDAAVAQIQAQKITLADAQGTNLPPVPDQVENDATVAGIDKNNNGVRDDVELAIFAKYPNSPKTRAAELQYAMNQEMYLTKVFNIGTWKAVSEEGDRAFRCIVDLHEDTVAGFQQARIKINEVEDMVFNTQSRKDAKDKAFEFTTSYGNPGTESCDVLF